MTPDLWIVIGILAGACLTCLLLMEREDWRELGHALRVAPRWYWRQIKAQRVRIRLQRGQRRTEGPREAMLAESCPNRPFTQPAAKGFTRREQLDASVRGRIQ